MSRVVVIGGGFAGLAAAETLRGKLDVLLIDSKPTHDFLPMLPDVIGERADPDLLVYDLADLCRRLGAGFRLDPVTSVDLTERRVVTGTGEADYDYLVIASGSRTTFYGQNAIRERARKLDDVADARTIADMVRKDDREAYVVVGGAYTGIEVATNLRAFFDKHPPDRRVVVCELQDRLVPALPERFQRYVTENVKRLGIELRLKDTVDEIDDGTVRLASGERIDHAAVIWSAGVRTPDFVQDLDVPKSKQGRLEVDRCLRLDDRAFAAGDSALFVHGGGPLRMSIQFALSQGARAAKNILRIDKGKPPEPFRPHDPGYIIPMANNRSCGRILGINCYGRMPTLAHYMMCIARSRGMRRRLKMFADLRRIL